MYVKHCLVNSLDEMHFHSTRLEIRVIIGMVDENADCLGSNLLRSISENKQQRIDNIRLSTTVRANNCRKILNFEKHTRFEIQICTQHEFSK